MAAIAVRRLAAGSVASVMLVGCAVFGAGTALADDPSPAPSTSAPAAAPTLMPVPAPAPVDFPLRPGDQGPMIGVLQDRLEWLGSSIARTELLTDTYGPSTQGALTALQRKFWLPMDGYVTRKTWDRIKAIAGPIDALPAACTGEDTICISTEQKLVRWVTDGKVVLSADARFGMPQTATARGTFAVTRKSRDHVSSLYRTAMPFALFFHGGQAVHYSAYFKRDGYYGASHGCVNLRDYAKAEQLYDSASVGTRVHVY